MKGPIKFNHILYLAGFLVLTLILFNLGEDDKQIPQTTAVQEKHTASCVDEKKLPAPGNSFDGKILYRHAFAAICNGHLKLADSASMKAFKKEWENKYSPSELSTEEKTDRAIAAMLASLNQRFDTYLLPQAVEAGKEQIDPTLSGIGAEISLTAPLKEATKLSNTNRLLIKRVLEGGPSEGILQEGDIITAVNGIPLVGLDLEDVVYKRIRGKAGTPVLLTIERQEEPVKVIRGNITMKVVSEHALDGNIAYIQLRDFMSKYAVKEFHDALERANKANAVIIDLRNNPGGNFDSVIMIASFLLNQGNLVVVNTREGDGLSRSDIALYEGFMATIEYVKEGVDDKVLKHYPLGIPQAVTQDRQHLAEIAADTPIVVLINERSASGSELLSGILKDRATLVGQPTLGKGVGQGLHPLPYGRELHVTELEFLPRGQSIDKVGVIPDLIVKDDPSQDGDEQLNQAVAQAKSLIEKTRSVATLKQKLEKEKRSFFLLDK
ncbi:MAG: S41 family peptidase [Cyanobacteriota/Melainabacteria group bacterium]|nr:PDZ domain-containing protein [Cyanobacteria bacterium HKST-UBA01]